MNVQKYLQKLARMSAELKERVEWHMLEDFIDTLPLKDQNDLCSAVVEALFKNSWGEGLHDFILDNYPTEEEQARMEQEAAEELAELNREWASTRL